MKKESRDFCQTHHIGQLLDASPSTLNRMTKRARTSDHGPSKSRRISRHNSPDDSDLSSDPSSASWSASDGDSSNASESPSVARKSAPKPVTRSGAILPLAQPTPSVLPDLGGLLDPDELLNPDHFFVPTDSLEGLSLAYPGDQIPSDAENEFDDFAPGLEFPPLDGPQLDKDIAAIILKREDHSV